MPTPQHEPAPPAAIHPQSVGGRAGVNPATVWLTYPFAPEWFADAVHEARVASSHHARRREVVFAVCCVESYLVEWVGTQALDQDYSRLHAYFPVDDRTGIRDRWKEVIKALAADGTIRAAPTFGDSTWGDFHRLVDVRDGLVHGRSSWPETTAQDVKRQPRPSKTDLERLEPGWAVAVVIRLIQALHDAIGTAPPSWLVAP